MATSDRTKSSTYRQLDNQTNTAIRWNVDTGHIRVEAEAGIVFGASGCRLTPTLKPNGYQAIGLQRPGGGQIAAYIHRVIGYRAWGDVALICEINHINFIKTDNRMSNLEPVTPSQNKQHSIATVHEGLIKRSFVKLTKEQVREIKALRKLGKTYREIAQCYTASESAIRLAAVGKTWKWIDDEE